MKKSKEHEYDLFDYVEERDKGIIEKNELIEGLAATIKEKNLDGTILLGVLSNLELWDVKRVLERIPLYDDYVLKDLCNLSAEEILDGPIEQMLRQQPMLVYAHKHVIPKDVDLEDERDIYWR